MALERYREALAELASMDRRTKLYTDDFARLLGRTGGPNSLSKAKLPPPNGHAVKDGHLRTFWFPGRVSRHIAGLKGRGVGGGRPRKSAEPDTL